MRLLSVFKTLRKTLLALIGIAFVVGTAPLALYIVTNDIIVMHIFALAYDSGIASSQVINAHGGCISVDADTNIDRDSPHNSVVTSYAMDRFFSTKLVTVTSSRLELNATWIDNTHIKVVANFDDDGSPSRIISNVEPIHIDYSFGHTFVDAAIRHTFEIGDVAMRYSGPDDCGPAFAPDGSPLDGVGEAPFPVVPSRRPRRVRGSAPPGCERSASLSRHEHRPRIDSIHIQSQLI